MNSSMMQFFGGMPGAAKKKKAEEVKVDVEMKPVEETKPVGNSTTTSVDTTPSKKGNSPSQIVSINEQVTLGATDDELKSLPWFVKPKFIQDWDRRKPSDPDYDNSTLYIPSDEFNRLTAIMQ